MGAEIAVGDLRDANSLRAACTGVRSVICTATSISSFTAENTFLLTDLGVKDLIDAAKIANAEQFIFVSFSAALDPDADLKIAKRAVEQHLVNSGLAYTVLRPSCFMEIWLGPALGFDAVNARVQIIGDGEARLSYISLYDVAEFAAASVANPVAVNVGLELGGPDAISPLEAVRIFEQASGRRFEVAHIPLEALHAQHAASTNPLEKSFAALMIETTKGNVIPMNDVLRRFPGIVLKSVEDYARQLVSPISAV
jgi:NADH dehydrogenase